MGCGSSKAVPVAQSNAPPKKVEVVPGKASQQSVSKPKNDAKKGSAKKGKKNETNEPEVITENTEGGHVVAAEGNNLHSALSVHGAKVQRNKSAASDMSGASSFRDMSATSTRSAPVVLERPSSRGGAAFDIQWEEESGSKALPRRLARLKSGSRPGSQKKNLTLGQLKKKLEEAEKRKIDYERRIQEKIAQVTRDPNAAEARLQRQATAIEQKSEADVSKKQDNREKHLKLLRDKLRAKEAHAQKVRENKRKAMEAAAAAS